MLANGLSPLVWSQEDGGSSPLIRTYHGIRAVGLVGDNYALGPWYNWEHNALARHSYGFDSRRLHIYNM